MSTDKHDLLARATPGAKKVCKLTSLVSGNRYFPHVHMTNEAPAGAGFSRECGRKDITFNESQSMDACDADAELFALAYDHALLLRAQTMNVCLQSGNQLAVVDGDGAVARDEETVDELRFRFDLDAAGCPVLTDELRAALRKAVGLP